jgi:hypothetical protein
VHRQASAWCAALLLAACTTVPMQPPAHEPPPLPPVQPPPAQPLALPSLPSLPEPEPAVVPEPPPVVVKTEPPATLRALQYFVQLKQRPQREQRIEQERLRKALAGSRSEHDRVRLALSLVVPGSSPKEELQAR